MDLSALQQTIHEFNSARGWDELHDNRGLVLSLTGEVGELAEIVAWGEGQNDAASRLATELSDILIYAACIANLNQIDLEAAVENKLARNAEKYPSRRHNTSESE